jgi:mRNA-degrading endonuclease RelE of RelBE toxin-antitoxin system
MEKNFKNIIYSDEFKRDLKKLNKRFRTLEDDIKTFVKAQLKTFHLFNIDNKGVVRISDLGIENPEIYKARKFACRAIKGRGVNSGIRVIYAYYKEEQIIELIEIYFKGDKETEDRERILKKYKKRRKNEI